MARKLVMVVAVGLGLALVAGGAGMGWLLYQPVKADLLVYRYYQQAAASDPGHATLYRRAYNVFASHTRSNGLHFAVHEAAATLASVTGHTTAARVQHTRAAYHLSPRLASAVHVVSSWLQRVTGLARAGGG